VTGRLPATLRAALVIDCHVHVVDPARFPDPSGPGYKPTLSDIGTASDLADVLAHHRVNRAVVVQLSGHGTDNACILDAVARSRGAWRAIVSLGPDFTDRQLDRLQQAGAVGVRFNVKNMGPAALTQQARLLDAIAERGWVAQIQVSAPELGDYAAFLAKVGAPLLFDHLGLPDVSAGPSETGFKRLLAFGRDGAFIKLSGAFRLSKRPYPHSDLDPFVAAIRAAFPPLRRIWGSDWPFVDMPSKPNYAETMAMLERWLPDFDERESACEQAPARLFAWRA